MTGGDMEFRRLLIKYARGEATREEVRAKDPHKAAVKAAAQVMTDNWSRTRKLVKQGG